MIKKILLWLSTSVLTLSILGFVFTFGFARLLQPKTTEGWIEKSGTYQKLPDALLTRAQTLQQTRGENVVDYSNPIVKDAAKTALSPNFIEQSSKEINDATFNWLQGESGSPEFSINLQPAKQIFVDTLAASLKSRYEALDSCGPAQIPNSTDPFTIDCRPNIDISISSIIATESSKLMQSTDFLANAELTTQNILPTEAGTKANPYTYSGMPTAYQALQTAPYALLALALLSGISVLFLASTKKSGVRKIGWRFVLAGILSLLLINLGALGLTKISEAATTQNTTAAITAYKDLVSAGITAVRNDSAKTLMSISIPVLLLGIILLITTRSKHKKTSTPVSTEEAKEDEPIATPASAVTQPSKTIKQPANPVKRPQPKTAPLLKPKQQQKPAVVAPSKRIGSNDTLIQ